MAMETRNADLVSDILGGLLKEKSLELVGAKKVTAKENCPHCDARLERGDDGKCNRCGKDWPIATDPSKVSVVESRDWIGHLAVLESFSGIIKDKAGHKRKYVNGVQVAIDVGSSEPAKSTKQNDVVSDSSHPAQHIRARAGESLNHPAVADFLDEMESKDSPSEAELEIGNALTQNDKDRYVILRGGKLVGAMSASRGKFATTIHHMGSLSKGVGTALLSKLSGKIIAKDVIGSAKGFYERLGFRPSRTSTSDMVHSDLKGLLESQDANDDLDNDTIGHDPQQPRQQGNPLSPELAGKIADRMKLPNADDWLACFHIAIDKTHCNVPKAIELADRAVEQMDDEQTVESMLESGFTGIKQTKAGVKRKYQDGKEVPMDQAGQPATQGRGSVAAKVPFHPKSNLAAHKKAINATNSWVTPEEEEKAAWHDADLSKLHATQEEYEPAKAEAMAKAGHQKRSEYGDAEVSVLRTKDGKEHIIEGHHRAAAAKIRGDKTVPTRLYVEDANGKIRPGTDKEAHKTPQPSRGASKPPQTPDDAPKSTAAPGDELKALSTNKKTLSALHTAVSAALSAAGGAIAAGAHAEHKISSTIAGAVAKAHPALRIPLQGLYALSMASYIAGKHAAMAIGKERGLSDEQTKRLGTTLATLDVLLAKPAAYAAHATGASAALAFIPAASLGYICYSTARNPMATLRVAGRAVAKVFEPDALVKAFGKKGGEGFGGSDTFGRQAAVHNLESMIAEMRSESVALLEGVKWQPLMGKHRENRNKQVGWISSEGKKVYQKEKPGADHGQAKPNPKAEDIAFAKKMFQDAVDRGIETDDAIVYPGGDYDRISQHVTEKIEKAGYKKTNGMILDDEDNPHVKGGREINFANGEKEINVYIRTDGDRTVVVFDETPMDTGGKLHTTNMTVPAWTRAALLASLEPMIAEMIENEFTGLLEGDGFSIKFICDPDLIPLLEADANWAEDRGQLRQQKDGRQVVAYSPKQAEDEREKHALIAHIVGSLERNAEKHLGPAGTQAAGSGTWRSGVKRRLVGVMESIEVLESEGTKTAWSPHMAKRGARKGQQVGFERPGANGKLIIVYGSEMPGAGTDTLQKEKTGVTVRRNEEGNPTKVHDEDETTPEERIDTSHRPGFLRSMHEGASRKGSMSSIQIDKEHEQPRDFKTKTGLAFRDLNADDATDHVFTNYKGYHEHLAEQLESQMGEILEQVRDGELDFAQAQERMNEFCDEFDAHLENSKSEMSNFIQSILESNHYGGEIPVDKIEERIEAAFSHDDEYRGMSDASQHVRNLFGNLLMEAEGREDEEGHVDDILDSYEADIDATTDVINNAADETDTAAQELHHETDTEVGDAIYEKQQVNVKKYTDEAETWLARDNDADLPKEAKEAIEFNTRSETDGATIHLYYDEDQGWHYFEDEEGEFTPDDIGIDEDGDVLESIQLLEGRQAGRWQTNGRWYESDGNVTKRIPDPSKAKPDVGDKPERKPGEPPFQKRTKPADPEKRKAAVKPKPVAPPKISAKDKREQSFHSAQDLIAKMKNGDGSPENTKALVDHLSALTVPMLKGLIKEHGLTKPLPAERKGGLVDRISKHVNPVQPPQQKQEEPKPEPRPAPPKEKPPAPPNESPEDYTDRLHQKAMAVYAIHTPKITEQQNKIEGIRSEMKRLRAVVEANPLQGKDRKKQDKEKQEAKRKYGSLMTEVFAAVAKVKELKQQAAEAVHKELFLSADTPKAKIKAELSITPIKDDKGASGGSAEHGGEHSKEIVENTKANIIKGQSFLKNMMPGGEMDYAAVHRILPSGGRAHVKLGRFAQLGKSEIRLGPNESPKIVVHEWAHAFEEQNPGIAAASLDFLHKRCGDEKPQPMNKLIGLGYDDKEMGRKDDFEKAFGDKAAYVGKDYGGSATEILSMGAEKLFDDPGGFATADPEYFKFVVGVLHGKIRGEAEADAEDVLDFDKPEETRPTHELPKSIKEGITDLGSLGAGDGMVKIDQLYHQAKRHHPDLSVKQFHEALQSMWDRKEIHMHTANDPKVITPGLGYKKSGSNDTLGYITLAKKK